MMTNIKSKLTELCEINALVQRLHSGIIAQPPENGEYKRCDDERGENEDPNQLQDVSDCHELFNKRKEEDCQCYIISLSNQSALPGKKVAINNCREFH